MLSASGNHYLLSSGSWGTASNSSIDSDGPGLYNGGKNNKEVKIVLVGKAGVGKSALVVRFITGRFLHCYNPTLEDSYQKNMRVDGENYTLNILDTAGQDDIHYHYYIKHADVLMITFAINDLSSLTKAKQIKSLVDSSSKGHTHRKVPVVLIGCKGDTSREVGTNTELVKLAREMDCSYVETSSAEGRNCGLPFRTAIKLLNFSGGCHNDTHLSPDRSKSSAIVRKCRNLLGINPQGGGVKQESSPSQQRSRTPETITITVSQEC